MNNNYSDNDFDYENEKIRKTCIIISIILAVIINLVVGSVLLILLKKGNNENKRDNYMRNVTVVNSTEKENSNYNKNTTDKSDAGVSEKNSEKIAEKIEDADKTKETESTTIKNKDLKYAKIYGEESENESANSNINNSTSNAITSSDYILPGSDRKYLTKDDLKNLNADTCRLARNELYARHGRLFDDAVLQNYFNEKSWYRGTIKPEDFTESMLNSYEIYNRDLIVEFEKEKGFR